MILEKETTAAKAPATGQVACKTCGHPFAGKYCNQCGEKVIEPRDLSVGHYLEDIFNAFTSLDTKVWRTVWLMARAPGGRTWKAGAVPSPSRCRFSSWPTWFSSCCHSSIRLIPGWIPN